MIAISGSGGRFSFARLVAAFPIGDCQARGRRWFPYQQGRGRTPLVRERRVSSSTGYEGRRELQTLCIRMTVRILERTTSNLELLLPGVRVLVDRHERRVALRYYSAGIHCSDVGAERFLARRPVTLMRSSSHSNSRLAAAIASEPHPTINFKVGHVGRDFQCLVVPAAESQGSSSRPLQSPKRIGTRRRRLGFRGSPSLSLSMPRRWPSWIAA